MGMKDEAGARHHLYEDGKKVNGALTGGVLSRTLNDKLKDA